MRVLSWVADHWWLLVIGIMAIVIWCLTLGRKDPMKPISTELEVINTAAEVRRMKALLGAEQAKQHVLDKYRKEMEALDEKKKQRAKELSNDPVKLSKFLVRAGKRC